MSLGLIGIESYEFVVHDLERSRRFYVDLMDFREIARGTRERTLRTGEESAVFRAGKIQVQVTTPLHQHAAAAKYLAWHPDGIPQVSFRVKSLDRAWKFLEERHATFLYDPVETTHAGAKYREFAIATSLGDVQFRFVERDDAFPGYAPGFEDLTPADEGNRYRFMAVDHMTMNMLSMWPHVSWLRDTLGFEQFWDVEFHTNDVRQGTSGSGLRSIVMRDPESNVKFASNEPLKPWFNASQIAKFVDDHRGAGVQHVAFITPAIIPAVAGLQGAGISFLKTPEAYYRGLPARFEKVKLSMDTIKEPLADLQRLAIQVDGGNERYMLQIFMQEGGLLYDDKRAGPFFYEIIQRAGDPGFGYGNFRALFESIERSQVGQRETPAA